MQEAIKRSKADYSEIRIEEKESTRIAYQGKDLENAGTVLDKGGIVRVLVRSKGWGVATFNNLDDLATRVDQAYQCAQVASSPEPIEMTEVEPVEKAITVKMKLDFRNVSLARKKALAERQNDILRGYSDKIIDTFSLYVDSFSRVTFANSQGTFIEAERPSVALAAVAIARDGDNVQQAHKTDAAPAGFEYVLEKEELAKQAARRAVELLGAKRVMGGQYPVVLDPMLAGVFIHEAFGHLSESDFVYENPKAKEMMLLGRQFGKNILNVYDDGSIEGLRGTTLYDDEGTPGRRNDLIKDGILVGRLHSRETAAKMGERPTGNARAVNYRFAPIVRMTNTAIQNGDSSFADMIRDIELGVYACDAYGGETQLENFSFSSGYAYMIRHGQIAEMVKDVILAGNLFMTLANIDLIGNDFRWISGAGGCGKANQANLPIDCGAPHIRIQNVVIGGES